jgi:hypothetical protein
MGSSGNFQSVLVNTGSPAPRSLGTDIRGP